MFHAVRNNIHEELKHQNTDSTSFKLDFFPQLSGLNLGDKNDDKENDSYTKNWKNSGTQRNARKKKSKKTASDGGNYGGRTKDGTGGGTGEGTSDGEGEGRGSGGAGTKKIQLKKDNGRLIKDAKTSMFKVKINNFKKNEKINILIKGEGMISDVPIKINAASSEGKNLDISKGNENWIKGTVTDDNGCAELILDIDSNLNERQYTVWYS